ncbi:glycosyltransferase family 2 protein [Rhodococcus aerolatus]
MSLAVVTVTYSPGEHLEVFLASLAAATTEDPVVVLADTGSVDGAPERAVAGHPRVQLLRLGENVGYGAAANRAVAALDPGVDLVVVANPDVRWAPGSLDVLLDAARRTPRAGALGPLVREPDGAVYPSAREQPSLLAGSGHAVLSRVWPGNPFSRSYRRSGEQPVERDAGWLSGSCLLLRRAAFASVGGFDSRYFMYFEDVDLGDRLVRAGWRCVYVPAAEVHHDQGHAADRAPAVMLRAHHESAARFTGERVPAVLAAPLRWGLRLRARLAVRRAAPSGGPGRSD